MTDGRHRHRASRPRSPRYGARTTAAVAEHLAEHLGFEAATRWLDDLLSDYPARGGKAHPAGLSAWRRASPSAAGGGGAAVGRGDRAAPQRLPRPRRHRGRQPAAAGPAHPARRHGVPLALNAGDALFVLAGAALAANRRVLGGRMAAAVAEEFTTMARHTVSGQATELGWRRDGVVDLTPEDYLDLIMRKTCWYTTVHPLRVGALIGAWGRADLDALVRFGSYLGAAFQIQDDLLNLEGDEARYGKEHAGDLYEGKRTLMLIHLLSVAAPAVRADVVGFLGAPPRRTHRGRRRRRRRAASRARQPRLRPVLRAGHRRRGDRGIRGRLRVDTGLGGAAIRPRSDRLDARPRCLRARHRE